jgi:hypothetical protein
MSHRRVRLQVVALSLASLPLSAGTASASGILGGVTDPVAKVVAQVVPPVAPIVSSPVVTQPVSQTAATPVQTVTGTASAVAQTATNVVAAVAPPPVTPTPSAPVSGGVAASPPARTPAPVASTPTATVAAPVRTVATTPAVQAETTGAPAPAVHAQGGSTLTKPRARSTAPLTTRVAAVHFAPRRPRTVAHPHHRGVSISVTGGYSVLVAELPAPPVRVQRVAPVATTKPIAAAAPAVAARGGLAAPTVTATPDRGFRFESPLGRFAIVAGGVLLGGSAGATVAGVSLVLPSGLVALAVLVGLIAVLAQRRVEQRRRVLR